MKMSTTTVKTDTTAHSKVLPGDKSGLPWEIWQMILSYLSALELCQASLVNKTWNDLVNSLDSTRWKELYLKCIDWRHPYWPLKVTCDPPSWKKAFMEHYVSVHYWSRISTEHKHSSCLYALKRRRERKVIKVGPGLEHESLKSALAVANSYDRIEVYPGIYDEQFEMSSKIPFELVGHGELGSVILVVSIEQVAITARLNNLVFRAPWFTTFILKIRSGFMQMDNCILEDGMVYIQHPGTCHISFCTFRHATVILQHINASIIENCEFSQSDIASIIVEGYMKEEKNWTFPHLCEKMNAVLETHNSEDDHQSSHVTMKSSESQGSVVQSATNIASSELLDTSSPNKRNQANDISEVSSMKKMSLYSQNQDYSLNVCNNCTSGCDKNIQRDCHSQFVHYMCEGRINQNEANILIHRELSYKRALPDYPNDAGNGDGRQQPLLGDDALLHNNADERSDHSALYDSDVESLSLLEDFGSGGSSSGEESANDLSSMSDSDSDSDNNILHTDTDEFSSSEDSIIMLPHLRMQQVGNSVSANNVDADVASVCSQTRPVSVSFSLENLLVTAFDKIQGCLINKCQVLHSKGGVVVSLQAHAMICECDISNVDYGIKCIQNARVVMLKNRIHHCLTSGIFMRLASSGLIAGNDIHSNAEAGLDIRKNADPIVQSNRIHHGKRSGIVVLGSGRGQIKKNEIFQNREAGVYVLYGGNPTISDNHIYDGRAAGIAINEGGRGLVFGNFIEGNQWGGIDIRHGGNPLVCQNSICRGVGDGIVIGENGQGSIENNVISGNASSGVWIMSASQPFLQGNQINNNGDAGVLFVNKMDVLHNPHISNGSMLLSAHSMRSDSLHHNKHKFAVVQYNNIYHNAGKGIVIQLGEEVHVCYNAIYANCSDGILVDQTADVLLKGNSISNNQGAGILSSAVGKITVQGNGIYHNDNFGIVGKCNVIISENDVVSNGQGGIYLEHCQHIKVSENRIQCSDGPAVILLKVREGSVDNNKIFDTGTSIQHDEVSVSVLKTNNMIQPGGNNSDGEKEEKDGFCKAKFLDSPAPRPRIEAPPAPSEIPLHNVSTVTRITLPSTQTAEQESKLCRIL